MYYELLDLSVTTPTITRVLLTGLLTGVSRDLDWIYDIKVDLHKISCLG